ncbi:MAG TPA: hypothetical protein VFY06_15375 [Verrucomicrobiae bacterium]|nr:hypothetical protein [Verrucomicrobiae bacterium]
MKIGLRLLLLVALIAAGVWLWTVLFPSPDKIVRKRLAQVAAEASFKPGENPLVIAARAENLADRFSTNAEIHLGATGYGWIELNGRAEITQAAARMRAMELRGLKVEFPDVSVTVGPDKLSAVADVDVEVEAPGEKNLNVQEMKFTFQKIDGDWLITRAETVPMSH